MVLGMHRSGTSALTKMLNILGAELPQKLIGASDSNDTGHWEPLRLVLLHDEMLAEAGSAWDDWRRLDLGKLPAARLAHYKERAGHILRDEFGDAPLIVLKDPRICRFLPFAAEVLAELNIECRPMLMIRDPLEVSASLRQRNRMGQSTALLLWLRHMLDAEAATRGYRRAFVSFEGLLADWRRARAAIVAGTGVPLAEADDVSRLVDDFLSPGRRHHHARADDLAGHPGATGWLETVVAQFRALEARGEHAEAIGALDRVAGELDRATPLLAGMEEYYQRQYAATVDGRVSRGLRAVKSLLRPLAGSA